MTYIFKINYLRNILVASAIIAVALPLCVYMFIFPGFIKLLTENTEDEAVRFTWRRERGRITIISS